MCEWCSTFIFFNRYCQYQSITKEPGLNLWLERVESPGSRRTAVLRVAWSHAARADTLRKKRGDTLVTGYVAGDGGVTGILAHSSPTRSASFAWTRASRYAIIQGHHARTRRIWTTTVVVVWFWPVGFFGEAANIWSIHGNTEREHQMDELSA